MAKFLVKADDIYAALYAAGVIKEDPESVARVVIDLQAGRPAYVYVEKFADDSIGDILTAGLAALPS